MLQRRLIALVFLCLILVAGYFFLHGFFTPDYDNYGQTSQATLRIEQLSSTDSERSVLYEIIYDQSLNKPSETIQVVYDKKQMANAIRFKSLLPKSSLVKLGQLKYELETKIFNERQRRLKEVEDHLNRSLTSNPERVSLSIGSNGIKLDVYLPRHQKDQNTAQASASQERIRQWAEQTLAQYNDYIMDVINDTNWLAPHLYDINAIIAPDLYTLDVNDDFTAISLIPNYAGISQRSQLALYPLARALYENAPGKDARSLIQKALTFVQAMPSAKLKQRELDGRATENFSSPADCLSNNLCDPDSKAVLLATLLSIMVPQTPIVMVQTQYDSFIGLPVPPKPDDVTFEQSGLTFVLSDPSSGEMTPVGKINSRAFSGAQPSAFTYVAIISGY